MASRRKQVHRIRQPEGVRLLFSPPAFEIIEALQTGGEATVAELGPRLGRRANSLHYHVRKLVDGGFVRQVGSRRSGARTVAVYDVEAESFEASSAPKDPAMRQAAGDAVATLLRLATRNFTDASENPPTPIMESGRHRNILANRRKAWLPRQALADVNRHIEAIERIFAANNGTRRGTLCAITVVLTPLDYEDHAPG